MSEKYKNKYRIKSMRLPNWDYGNNGRYFITICTQNRICFFGKIINREMQLNTMGKLAYKYWDEIPIHFPFVKLGEFAIMPDHMHGILIIDKTDVESKTIIVDTLHCNVSTTNTKNQQMANISPKPGSISTIIRSYKSVVTKNVRKIHTDFGWQS